MVSFLSSRVPMIVAKSQRSLCTKKKIIKLQDEVDRLRRKVDFLAFHLEQVRDQGPFKLTAADQAFLEKNRDNIKLTENFLKMKENIHKIKLADVEFLSDRETKEILQSIKKALDKESSTY